MEPELDALFMVMVLMLHLVGVLIVSVTGTVLGALVVAARFIMRVWATRVPALGPGRRMLSRRLPGRHFRTGSRY